MLGKLWPFNQAHIISRQEAKANILHGYLLGITPLPQQNLHAIQWYALWVTQMQQAFQYPWVPTPLMIFSSTVRRPVSTCAVQSVGGRYGLGFTATWTFVLPILAQTLSPMSQANTSWIQYSTMLGQHWRRHKFQEIPCNGISDRSTQEFHGAYRLRQFCQQTSLSEYFWMFVSIITKLYFRGNNRVGSRRTTAIREGESNSVWEIVASAYLRRWRNYLLLENEKFRQKKSI